MRRIGILAAVLLAASAPSAAAVRGAYLEARTADVYTGPCFANGEVNLAGKEATLGWRVEEGSFDGVPLDGLAVVAVVRSDATFGDPHREPAWTRARILVDARADARERKALEALAHEFAGPLLPRETATEAVPIAIDVDAGTGEASLVAGSVVEIRTRGLCRHDLHCGNEEVYYPPLVAVDDPVAAYALVHEFRGEGLGATWKSNEKRSAFLGRFER